MSTINDLLARVHDLEDQLEALRTRPAPERFKAVLRDEGAPNRPGQVVEIDYSGGALTFNFKGYGTGPAQEGRGEPLMIEVYEGELRVVAWADINQEDPSHTLSLEGAREGLRA